MTEVIQVRAVVLGYTPNAMDDSFDDGGFAVYDAARIRVKAPDDLAGREVTIYLTGEIPKDSLWRAIGRTIVFNIDKSRLVGGATLFDGAVSGLRADAADQPKG